MQLGVALMLRWDIATNDWVIFAPSRALRPDEFKHFASAAVPDQSFARDPKCPFCSGNEALTPPEIAAVRDNSPRNTPRWKVRVAR
jgi:UDPglucose--hexose-1-phosphate uridylyltransferase